MIIDWYEHVKDQPLTCIIQVNSEELKDSGERIKLPSYLQIDRDITNKEEFNAIELARRTDLSQLVTDKSRQDTKAK